MFPSPVDPASTQYIPMKRQIPVHYTKFMQITLRLVEYEILYFQGI